MTGRKISNKPLFSISVAADLAGLHPRTLMLYESKGVLTPYRTGTNRRLYSPKNIIEIKFIQFLTQEKGINLAGVKTLLKAFNLCRKQNFNLKKELFPDYKEESPL